MKVGQVNQILLSIILKCLCEARVYHNRYYYDQDLHVLVYKSVVKKVRMVPMAMLAKYRIMWQLPDDPLAGLPELPPHPPDCVPGTHFMQERADKLDLDPTKWLWPEELKLVCWLVCMHELTFAWCATERGCLNEKYFPPYKIPMVLHTP